MSSNLAKLHQCQPWELGPSNRLAMFPQMVAALALDLELCCSSYRHVREITGDLSQYEKQLLWANLSPELIAKVRKLKARATAQTFVSNVIQKQTLPQPQTPAKPRARAHSRA